MSKFDYEIAKYCVQWDFVGVHCNEKEFSTEDEAIEFAREKYNKGYETRVQKILNIIGW